MTRRRKEASMERTQPVKPCQDATGRYLNCQPTCKYKADGKLLPGCVFFVDTNRRGGSLVKAQLSNQKVA